jgi:hypothetical protein
MRTRRWLIIPFLIPFLFLLVLGCNMVTREQTIQNAITTQIPNLMTGVPTAQGMIETLAAQQASNPCTGTPTTGGLGIVLDHAKTLLQATGQFSFTDGTIDGLPASTATLASPGTSTFSEISNGFSAQFIGDPCNLSKIVVTTPYSGQPATIDQGLAAISFLFTTLMPLDVQLQLLPWLNQNYSNVPVSGQQQTTIKNMQFTLSRTPTEMHLEILPTK